MEAAPQVTTSDDRLRCPLCHGGLGQSGLRECVGCATRFHRGCWRELGGCSTLGCPEAGRVVVTSAVDEKAHARPAAATASVPLAALGVVIGWVAGVFSALLGLACVAGGVLPLVLARRRRPAAVALALSPAALPVLSALKAVVGYFTGSAVLLTVGLMGAPPPLDPVLRCRVRSTGCMVSGYDDLWNLPNNVTLRVLGALFGPVRGAYDGPLPSDERAEAALDASDHLVSHDRLVADGRVVVAGVEVTLSSEAREELAGCPWRDVHVDEPRPRRPAPLRLALVEGRALVVADEHARALGRERGRCVWLLDARTGAVVQRRGER